MSILLFNRLSVSKSIGNLGWVLELENFRWSDQKIAFGLLKGPVRLLYIEATSYLCVIVKRIHYYYHFNYSIKRTLDLLNSFKNFQLLSCFFHLCDFNSIWINSEKNSLTNHMSQNYQSLFFHLSQRLTTFSVISTNYKVI